MNDYGFVEPEVLEVLNMAMLTREAILAAPDIQQEVVAVPEWGGDVIVRGLSGAQRDAFEASVVEQKGKKTEMKLDNIRARLVALSVVDEKGKLLFSDKDVVALGKKSARPLQRLWDKARELSGLSDDDVEELAKNSSSDQGDDSSSA
jgi:hypothetical protein